MEEVGLIPEGVEVAEDMSLRRLSKRGSTTEVLNRGLDILVIEANNLWSKIEKGKGREEGLSMIATYTQVEKCITKTSI